LKHESEVNPNGFQSLYLYYLFEYTTSKSMIKGQNNCVWRTL